jgi:hypothetical protein
MHRVSTTQPDRVENSRAEGRRTENSVEFLLPETPGRKIPWNSGYRYLQGWENQLNFRYIHIIFPVRESISIEKRAPTPEPKPRMGFHMMNLLRRFVDVPAFDSIDMNALTGNVSSSGGNPVRDGISVNDLNQ